MGNWSSHALGQRASIAHLLRLRLSMSMLKAKVF